VDQHSIFRFVEHQGVHVSYRLRQDQGRVQFRRALEELGIGIIYAHSPEAKGKIEKRFDYFQRRLPYLCERYKVTDIQEANRILREEVIPYYNERHIHAETEEIPQVRWQRAIRENRAKLRPLPEEVDLDIVFSLQYQRSVGKDGTISFDGKRWKSGAQPEQKVIACLHPGSKLIIVQDGVKLWEYQL